MSDLQLWLSHLVKLGLLALLAGVLARGRVGLCVSFFAYVVAILIGNSLTTLVPGRFFNHSFWMLKQGVYDLLKVAVAVELAWRAFAAFPGAWRTARLVLFALLGTSALWLGWLTPHSYQETIWRWQPGVVTGAIWLLTAIALLVVFYQVPIHDWQRAIMLGFAPYLLVSVTALNLLRRRGWDALPVFNLLDVVAYLAVVLFWAWAAWHRPDRMRPAGGTPARGMA